jgi:hypothetical protein
MDVYIRWINHSEEWVTLQNFSGVVNGTYMFVPFGNDWIWGDTEYIWSVNITDGISWTNESYYFTTGGSRYDVDNNDIVDFRDAGLCWANRESQADYDGLYDVDQNMVVDFRDAGLCWANRD